MPRWTRVTLLDTAEAYHRDAHEVGHSETLIAEALGSWVGDRDTLVVATKSGHLRPGDGSWTTDGRRSTPRRRPRPRYSVSVAMSSTCTSSTVPTATSLRRVRRRPRRPAGPGGHPDGRRLQRDRGPDPRGARVLGRRLVSVQNQFSPAFRSSEAELAAREVPGGRPDPGVEPPGDRTLLRSGGNAHAEPRTR